MNKKKLHINTSEVWIHWAMRIFGKCVKPEASRKQFYLKFENSEKSLCRTCTVLLVFNFLFFSRITQLIITDFQGGSRTNRIYLWHVMRRTCCSKDAWFVKNHHNQSSQFPTWVFSDYTSFPLYVLCNVLTKFMGSNSREAGIPHIWESNVSECVVVQVDTCSPPRTDTWFLKTNESFQVWVLQDFK